MMRSLYSGVSGLRNHQTRMDVIGNNISNVNTVGFKSSRVVFQDVYSQTSKAASGPSASGTLGGTNPIQIGLGVTLSAIDVLHTSSATQRTDNALDLCIEGEGFFIVDTNGTDVEGGYMYTRAGNFYIDNEGNLVNSNGYYVLGFTEDTPPTEDFERPEPDDEHALTDLKTINLAAYTNISIDDTGAIRGIGTGDADTEGETIIIGYLALSTFTNPPGLEKVGNSLYQVSGNSGTPVIGTPTDPGFGSINPGGLEMSNVDLANEFTDMIVTQRGFQANSRVITTSDSMLEELVNLKR